MLAVLRIIICVQIMELVSFISLSSAMNFSKSLYGVFPVPIGQFISVTYRRRTGRKRLDKNRMRMRALLFEIKR